MDVTPLDASDRLDAIQRRLAVCSDWSPLPGSVRQITSRVFRTFDRDVGSLLDLSHFRAAPGSPLGGLGLEGQGAFPYES